MSPRHFAKLLANPVYNKELQDQIGEAPNLWYAFTTVTGISNLSKLFTYTPKQIPTNPVKDSKNGR